MRLGVVIPCYRQERFLPRTLAALESALAGVAWQGALVIAAPGGEAAPPVPSHWRVIAPPVPRPLTPGAARMLGLSALEADWVLFVDADVEMEAPWVERALAAAACADPPLGGLGGRIEEWIVDGAVTRRGNPDMYRAGEAERPMSYLATLACYRREALIQVGGYDARLNSEEDYELGMRFERAGYTLRTLPGLAARHWSGPRPSLVELARRWRSGLCFGMGQVLRLYLGRPGFFRLLARQRLYLATLGMWALGIAALGSAILGREARWAAAWLLIPVGVLGLMTARKRSLRLAAHSLLTWTVNGLGLVVGFFRIAPALEEQAARTEAR